MLSAQTLPLFHPYGDSPDEQAFDFVHIETIAARASGYDWTIRAQRHGHLSQILYIGQGGGEMTCGAGSFAFAAPAAILVPSGVAHGFRFEPGATEGWIVSFADDVTAALGGQSEAALARFRALAAQPVVPLSAAEGRRLADLCMELHQERFLAREGFRVAVHGLLALIAIEVMRLAAGRARSGEVTPAPAEAAVDALRGLIEEHYRRERLLVFYAAKLATTPDRLNDQVKRATGVTAGHLIRQRVLTEAKRQLVFTNRPIQEIACDLAFSDPSHFARFFRKHTGMTPQSFREHRSG
ncbi:MAG: helix-turn-helix domain-containing protein [Xanthobacteraceae bacterium]